LITEIPLSSDFMRSSLDIMNLAWSVATEIIIELYDSQEADFDEDITTEYWKKSQPALGNAFALIQQAQEMALKGKIAEISPFLLIGRDPREWPRRCDQVDIPFSSFRMANAADLIKIYNSVCPSTQRLGEDFREFFDKVRRQRNSIMHLGGFGMSIKVEELLTNVLLTNEYLHPGAKWIKRRRDHLENDRFSAVFLSDHVVHVMLREFDIARRLLKPLERWRYLDLSKARRYHCLYCQNEARDFGDLIALAQLVPGRLSVKCIICEKSTIVVRKRCISQNCKSNVICADPEWGSICLLCHHDQNG
jgi:hypothetical protein